MRSYTMVFGGWAMRMAVGACVGGALLSAAPRLLGETPPEVPAQELPAGSQILSSGPVHEAFAKPVTLDPQAPVIVTTQPPANLQESAPAERPDGGCVWVPGYWAWDADRNDFVWVSGCWRLPPPNTYWVPGYWLQADNGWQWIAGFWKTVDAQAQQQTIEYLPVPPAVQTETVVATAQADQIWVPGCWYWVRDRYVWRPGYLMTQQVGWVWVPSHYVWTPRGYIFCTGHWDYDLDRRGVLFTPAYFPPSVRVCAGFVFSPSVCVDLGVLRVNLFAYPRYRHYYFGDYYDDAYRRVGIYPWFQCETVHVWYDPLFVYDRWHFRNTEPHWAEARAKEFEVRRHDRDLRPPRVFSEAGRTMPTPRRNEKPLVASVHAYAASRQAPSSRFENLKADERRQITAKASEVQSFRDQRTRWEAQTTRGAAPQPIRKGETANPAVKESQPRSVAPVNVRTSDAVNRQARESSVSSVPAATRQTPVVPRAVQEPRAPQTQPSVQPQPVRVTRPEREVVPNAFRGTPFTVPRNAGTAQNTDAARAVNTQTPQRSSVDSRKNDPNAGRDAFGRGR